MKLSPIALFVYNRLYLTEQTVEALKNNYLAAESDLHIFSDGAKNEDDEIKVQNVRKTIEKIEGFKSVEIHYSKENKGLANSIVSGVSKLIEDYGKVIVLEDDLITTPNFLDFLNSSLVEYQENKSIKSINGYSLKINHFPEKYNYDNYIVNRPYSWGWATWKNSWDKKIFDDSFITTDNLKQEKDQLSRKMGEDVYRMIMGTLLGNIDSWYSKWIYYHYKTNSKSVYPKKSKVQNIGFDENGTHCKNINVHEVEMDESHKRDFKFIQEISVDDAINKDFLKYFTKEHKIKYRLGMLKSKGGREKLFNEFKDRFL